VATKGYVDSVSGGGAGATFGTATLDFGAWPGSSEASLAVTGQASIGTGSKVDVFVMASDTTSDHTASDHRYFAALTSLTAGTIVAATGFTIYATALDKLSGTFAVRWRWS
jgi:hypothetical protein